MTSFRELFGGRLRRNQKYQRNISISVKQHTQHDQISYKSIGKL